jgi:oligoendopeptidase F
MTTAPGSGFVPDPLHASTWINLEGYYNALRERGVDDDAELETWLIDRGELDSAAGETRAKLYINMTRRTDDESTMSAWSSYLDEVPPRLKPVTFELDRKQAELMDRLDAGERFAVLARKTRNAVELFREENVELQTQEAKLDQQYDKVCGDMLIDWEGEQRTIPQMGKLLQEDDRDVRKRAWRAVASRRLQDRAEIERIFDRMIELRQKMARNAGFDNYRDYEHQAKDRFDYTPDDCATFHEAVEKHVVPFLRENQARRQQSLGVDPLRPWDLAVDEHGRPPLRPFERGQELVEKTRTVFEQLDPQLAELFRTLGDDVGGGSEGWLDLESRKGKATGGYQYELPRSKKPFIFMNAAGLHRDVETMIHEAGHAFHSLLCAHQPIAPHRDYPIEFAEVASMAMELLTMPYWDAYYPNEGDADRARRQQLEGSVTMLAWIATIDAFQHWIYTNPGHTPEQRADHWVSLRERFGGIESWDGLEEERRYEWQRQGHLFGVPFYYIEYGIAQLGALGVWLNSLKHGQERALTDYKRALSLGGTRPLPQLFQAAGVPFDFGPRRVEELVAAVRAELDKLPA